MEGGTGGWKERVSDGDRRRDINRGGDGRIMHSSFWPGRGSGLSVRRGRREEEGGGAGEGKKRSGCLFQVNVGS